LATILFPYIIGFTAFLCLLNGVFAYVFRKRRASEVVSYLVAGLIELAVFTAAILLHVGLLHHIPYRLPAGVPFTRTELGAALAVGIGLFPAAYWHRTSASTIRARIALDAKVIKEQDGGVRVRNSSPGEWMN
jgi:hypothetical protein